LGGLSKKASTIKELTNSQAKPTLFIDSGNLLFKAGSMLPESLAKTKIAADGIFRAHQAMGATFAGVGNWDLAAGVGFLRQFHRPPAFSWLSLNLIDPVSRKPLFLPWVTREIGGLRLAILALTDHTAPATPHRDFIILPWRESLPQILRQIEARTDLIVLLSNYSFVENKEIARSHGSIDLILQSGHVAGNLHPIVIQQTLIAQTDTRGRYLGQLDIAWNGRGRWTGTIAPPTTGGQPSPSTFAGRFIALVPSIPDDPQINQIVQQTKRRLVKTQ
jgi:2',3'-cyclic-nucleotide 2'-phosphodiesterase (5'-nucleotidase family)